MENVSTLAKIAIEQLLSVHALASYARASGNNEHLQSAAGWLPKIEDTLRAMRCDLEQQLKK